jgi:predicted tellurium resistance membrane protein TerC
LKQASKKMSQLLALLQQSIFITSIDLDNATYTTSAIQHLKPEKQQIAIFWGTLLEFIGRLLLTALFLILTNEDEPLFTLFGVEFTIENISLFGAGTFLLIRNGRELIDFFRTQSEAHETQPVRAGSFRNVIFEMGVVLTIMSIDTVLAGLGITSKFSILLFLFLFSAVVRLLFVRQIAAFVVRYPAINIVILTFLILIGIELIIQGLGIDIEPLFNLIMVVALIVAINYHRQKAKPPVSS